MIVIVNKCFVAGLKLVSQKMVYWKVYHDNITDNINFFNF